MQTRHALERLAALLPSLRFEEVPLDTPGDRDLRTDLRVSPADFFTRDLDEAVLNGTLDAALHSAKDLPDPMPAGLDWCWMPWREDARDVLVLRRDLASRGLPARPVIGISSGRREMYARQRFPSATLKPVRGAVEERVRQLDAGEFDALLLAAAGLARLGLAERISEWIPLADLPTPPGQGALGLTFREGDLLWLRVRSLLVKPVVFAGAGSGSAESWTLGALDALARCDACFHDNLLNEALLQCLPAHAERIDVGKRCGDHTVPQSDINALLTTASRRGRRVVRLKGGDPGIFGRLTEEIEALDALHLPYRVIPGVTSLSAATTGTGMLLTRRGVSRGFTVMTPRQENGGAASVRAEARAALPMAFFMGVGLLREIRAQLAADGLPGTTPAAVVFDAGSADETVIRGSLADIAEKAADLPTSRRPPPTSRLTPSTSDFAPSSRPGLILVGSPAVTGYHPEWGAMMGRRVLLPCSEALQGKTADVVRDFGGVPVPLPLIRMTPEPACIPTLKRLKNFDWLVVTSPSSVHILWRLLREAGVDIRHLPRILTAGPGTTEAFGAYGIVPEITPPRNFGADGLLETVRQSVPPGAALLRLRSQRAGPDLVDALAAAGYRADDCVLYRNDPLRPERIPAFDAVFFASASAVESFMALQPAGALAGKTIVAMGKPTLTALEKHGVHNVLTPPDATVDSAIEKLAVVIVEGELEKRS